MPCDNCGYAQCEGHGDEYDEPVYDDDELMFDDPYDVVMYDIDVEDDDLYALIDMLGDSARSWYAKRRLNALAASGPLSALVAAIIIDSLGRRWNPLEHPRDRFGRFINTGGFFRWLAGNDWLRGQVTRIDSDGMIHARSIGNDSVPDGTLYKFKPHQSVKLVSTKEPRASLSAVDIDADIPDFPEASRTQKRIYNALQSGDMPAEDLDRYRSIVDSDTTPEDFAAQITGLKERGLVDIDQGGKPRVRRNDDADLGIVSVEDDQIADVPEDETPDLEDSPNLTKQQRDLLDFIIDADRGEGDGVRFDELENADADDIQALVDAGILSEDGGILHVENPEGAADAGDAPAETDISMEIVDASEKLLNDPDAQEAFQHFAEELARPGDENNMPLPDGLRAAKLRNAEEAANKWWEERNAGTPDAGTADAPDVDAPEADAPNPKDVLNPQNRALADDLAFEWFNDNDYIKSKEGEEYRRALSLLFDAEDYEENGFDDRARLTRGDANRALLRLKDVDEDIAAGWPQQVKDYREGRLQGESPDAAPEAPVADVVPEADPEADVPEADVPEDVAPDVIPESEVPEEGFTVAPDWKQFDERMAAEGDPVDFDARLDQENRIADELGLDLYGEDAPWTWQNLTDGLGVRPAELLYNDSNGSLGEALAKDPAPYIAQHENELMDKFLQDPNAIGPGAMVLRKAGLIERDGDKNQWRLTQAGKDRLGFADVPEGDATSDAVTDTEDRAFDEEALADFAEWQAERNRVAIEAEDVADADIAPEPGTVDRILDEEEAIAQDDGAAEFDAPGADGWPARNPDAVRDVRQAMQAAQDGDIDRADAYEIAALAVQNGQLSQADLERIQRDVKKSIEARGGKWDVDREIDYVGDDQRAVDAADPLDADGAAEPVKFEVGEGDALPADGNASYAKVIDQPDFLANKPDLSLEGDVLDRRGGRVRLGGWYKANAGGEGDPDQVVGFYRQDRYPGWVLVQTPDGKLKAVHATGAGPKAGLNPMPDPGTEQRENIRVQRAVGGKELLELDQNNKKNVLFGGQRAEIGMRVRGRGNKGLFNEDTEGVIVRIGWNPVADRPDIFVIMPGARGQGDELKLAPKSLVPILEGTPATPAALPDVPNPPDVPGIDPNNLPDREWPVPSDQELLDRLKNLGGEVEFIPFNNAHQNPGAVYDQVMALVDGGEIEIVPGDGADKRLMIRLLGGDGVDARTSAPVLPNGANDAVDGGLLDAIDGAGEGGLGVSDLVNLEDDDAGDKLIALRQMAERGVLRKTVDADGRNPIYTRAPVLTPASGSRTHDPARGTDAGREPMAHAQAVAALTAGADPMTVNTPDLRKAMQDSGRFEFRKFKKNGNIGDTEWAVDNQVKGPHSLDVDGPESGRVYFVKRPRESDPRGNWRSELYAAAISHNAGVTGGDMGFDTGGLYHPQTTSVSDSRIIADHSGYAFPPGTVFGARSDMSSRELAALAPDRIRLVLYDYLINNSMDRHGGNQMYARLPDGSLRVIVIDNGFGDGENYSHPDPTNNGFDAFIRARGTNRTKALLEDIKDKNNGLTRSDLRTIVASFAQQYGNMDVEQIMARLRRDNKLSTSDIGIMTTWMSVAEMRASNLSANVDEIVDALAATIGVV